MMPESVEFVKEEVRFFMDKAFQASYVYLAALFGIVTVSRLRLSESLGGALGGSIETVVAAAVLVVNCIYLMVSVSCMYSVIKRGLFILQNMDPASTMVRWEGFMRQPPKGTNALSWNTDNFYFGTIAVLVLASSVAAFIFGTSKSETPWIFYLLGALHVLPALAGVSLARLDRECRREIGRRPVVRTKKGAGT